MAANADTYLSRNASVYELRQYAIQVVTTNPAQPNQPVYSWRKHTNFDGGLGNFSQSATYIGKTDAKGRFVSEIYSLPYQENLCGKYIDEQVAVGSPYARKSNKLNFIVKAPRLDFGPLPDWIVNCRP